MQNDGNGILRYRVVCIDSPVIYGDRVETSKPYHLIYIDINNSIVKFIIPYVCGVVN